MTFVSPDWFVLISTTTTAGRRSAVVARRGLTLLPIFAALFGTGSISAQRRMAVSDVKTCAACTIRMGLIAVLGENRGSGKLPAVPNSVVRDWKGRFVLADADSPPLLFDSVGNYLGYLGSTQNRFRGVSEISWKDSTVVMVDELRRKILFADTGLRRVSTTDWRWTVSDLRVLSPSRVALSSNVQTRAHIGLPVLVVEGSGEVSIALGEADTVAWFRPEQRTWIARGSSAHLWLAKERAYRLEEWTEAGELLTRVTRSPSWYQAIRNGRQTLDEGPGSSIRAVYFSDSLLWVIVSAADSNWRSAITEVVTTEGRTYRVNDYDKFLDTVVEAIDVRSGKLIASSRFDFVVSHIAAPNMAVSPSIVGGVTKLRILRIALDSTSTREEP